MVKLDITFYYYLIEKANVIPLKKKGECCILPMVRNMKYILKEIFLVLIMAAAIYFGTHIIFQQHFIEQTSMTPTLAEGQRIFINKLVDKPDRGDIIVFNNPENPKDTSLIKRVIGLPGEEVAVRSGVVYINGSPLTETYIIEIPHYTLPKQIVPNSEYFVLGDNRNASRDSHMGWTVPQDDILGKAWLSIWPLDHLGLIPDYAYADE
ncbi:signal peptidase I [Chloroflexota bacterium]